MFNRFSKSDSYDISIENIYSQVSFPKIKAPTEIQSIMDLLSDKLKIRTLSSREIIENSMVVSYYSLYLLSEENKLHSLLNWCESNIKHLVGKNLDSTAGYGFNEKDAKIRSTETNAVELEKLKLETQVQLDSLRFISQKLQFLSDGLKSLAFEKNKERVYS